MARYYDDPMQRDLDTRITDIGADRRSVVLEDTVFYPEGGGQPGDRGLMALPDATGGARRAGDVEPMRITDTQKREDGTVEHRLAASLPPEVAVGASVRVQLDWGHRWDYMQQHTGQHVLSAALLAEADAPTVSVHQGTELTTIEVDRETLSEGELAAVMARANRIIREDRAVSAFWVDSSELEGYELRRPTSRTGAVRLVRIEETDLVACGGVHLPRTGMLNLVHCVSMERIRGRVRLGFMIGQRALTDYAGKDAVTRRVSTLLSVPPLKIPERIEQGQAEAQDLRGELRRMRERLAVAMWRQAHDDTRPVQRLALEDEDSELFTAVVEAAATDPATIAVLGNQVGSDLQWALVVGTGHPFPATELRKQVLEPSGARGGGKPPIWRGIIRDADAEGFSALAQRFETLISGD